jgi:hypothetical protein
MTIGFIYWLLIIIGLIIGAFYRVWPAQAGVLLYPVGGLYLLVLLVLLGIGTFGWPIRG